MFMKNRILISMVLGATTLSFVGCGDTTTSDPNDFSMCDSLGYTDSTANALDALSGEKPVITLYGDRIITVPTGTASILADGDRAEAYDPQDGDLTNQIQRSNDVDLNQAGEYHIKYSVEDSDGNQDIKCRKVIVEGNNTDIVGIYDNGNDNYTYGDYNYGDYNNNDGYVDGYTGGSQNDGYLGTIVDVDDSTQNYSSNDSKLDTFITWYSNTCGRAFNPSLYNEDTKTYKGKIDCSHMGLTSIDLTPLSVFDGINEIDLSHNRLTYIDFSPIRDIHTLWKLNISYNTQELKNRYNTPEKRKALFRYFTNLHGGDGKTGLWIGFKPRSEDKEELRIEF